MLDCCLAIIWKALVFLQVVEEEKLRCKLAFFLHIPFPSWDIMRLFPWDDEILQGMLGKYMK
jgi:trehalose 6-phosphate synthase/phosphatase